MENGARKNLDQQPNGGAKMIRKLALAMCAGIIAVAGAPAYSQTVEEFYKGKTVTFIVPFSPGGTSSRYSDLFSRHFGKHIPGQPNIQLEYMPGGGGLVALNHAYTQAARDGSVFFLPDGSAAVNQLLNPEGARYDAREYGWIGIPSQARSVLMVRTDAGVNSVDDLKKTEIFVGSTGAGSETDMYPRLANGLIGTKMNVLPGYEGGSQVMVALEAKEVSGAVRTSTAWASRKDLVDKGIIKPLLVFASNRIDSMPDVPTLGELVANPEDKQIVALLTSIGTLGYGLGAPPEVPADRLAALRKAFDDMIKDPEYLADAEKSGLMLDLPLTGEEAQAFVAEVLKTSPELVERTRTLIAQ
jgi:tripartite-type tricarboxylate transporter receptor subunit TctC